jgi:hypothetical protein
VFLLATRRADDGGDGDLGRSHDGGVGDRRWVERRASSSEVATWRPPA